LKVWLLLLLQLLNRRSAIHVMQLFLRLLHDDQHLKSGLAVWGGKGAKLQSHFCRGFVIADTDLHARCKSSFSLPCRAVSISCTKILALQVYCYLILEYCQQERPGATATHCVGVSFSFSLFMN
jgi:hypothetical protein